MAKTHTVAAGTVAAKQVSTLRATRIAAVQAAYVALGKVAQQQKRAATQLAIHKEKQAQYMLAVQKLAAQFGLPPVTQQVRSVAGAQKHAPSAQSGACKQVHALAVQHNFDRAATLAAAVAAGVNPHTAKTQYQIAKQKHAAGLL